MNETEKLAQRYLVDAYGSDASFKDGQLEAIVSVVKGKRALVVQKTGWGKSLIYFLSTKMLRDEGNGLTIVISPLLALMNNQLEAASKFKLVSRTINSNNTDEWDSVIEEIGNDEVDILFISPEKLANEKFNSEVLGQIRGSIGMLVIDEAHCISDWGHDFRPDYRRIINIVRFLPPNVPLLATTATANNRVIEDVAKQLGENILIQRGSLMRESLAIQVIHLDRKEERLAWLSENIDSLNGTGIIYCLTKNDCDLVSGYLKSCGVDAYAYYSGIKGKAMDERQTRLSLEQMFMKNEMKVLVATTAFGMGIDKPDIAFVIHFQKPGNVVSYYQQIGRAGRGIPYAYAILLAGNEDDVITKYFINNAFPTYQEMGAVVELLEAHEGLSINEIMQEVDVSKGRLEKCLKYMSINGDVYKEKTKYFKSLNKWEPDMEYSRAITETRMSELRRMNVFINSKECYMKFLGEELNDINASQCNKCSNCLNEDVISIRSQRETILEAIKYIKKEHYTFDSRKQWPSGVKHEGKTRMAKHYQCEKGRALSNYSDAGWGREVSRNKFDDGCFSNDLVKASADMLAEFVEEKEITWVTSVSSLRSPELVRDFAERLAKALHLPHYDCIIKTYRSKQQKEFHNSQQQYKNAWDSFEVENVQSGNVLLIDDTVDSRWTFTVCGYKLLKEGSGKVYPFALANGAGSGGKT